MAKAKNTDKLVVQNAAKTLLANIRFASVDDPIRTITVTSSIPNEGKSTVSINLAQAIATSGKSVLLVEADMRRTGHPCIHFAFLQLMQRKASSIASSALYPRQTSSKLVALTFGA